MENLDKYLNDKGFKKDDVEDKYVRKTIGGIIIDVDQDGDALTIRITKDGEVKATTERVVNPEDVEPAYEEVMDIVRQKFEEIGIKVKRSKGEDANKDNNQTK